MLALSLVLLSFPMFALGAPWLQRRDLTCAGHPAWGLPPHWLEPETWGSQLVD